MGKVKDILDSINYFVDQGGLNVIYENKLIYHLLSVEDNSLIKEQFP